MKTKSISRGLMVCASMLLFVAVISSIVVFTSKANADTNERVISHISELDLYLAGDHAATESDYTLVTTATPYNLDLLTDNWEIYGTASHPVMLSLPNGGSFTTNGLILDNDSTINYKGNVDITILAGTELNTGTMTETDANAKIALSGSGKFKARCVKTHKFTINGPEVFIINNSTTDFYALRIGEGNSDSGLYLNSGKLVCQINPGLEGVSSGIMTASSILEISDGAELFASGQAYGILFTKAPPSLVGNFTGSIDFLTYENRAAASNSVDVVYQEDVAYLFAVGGDLSIPAKSIMGVSAVPAPTPDPVVTEAAQTSDNTISLVVICVLTFLASTVVLIRKKYNSLNRI